MNLHHRGEREISIVFHELLQQKVDECEIFSNPIRTTLALVIRARDEATWAEIKQSAEKITGVLNPNTISFHLNKLLKFGFIEKVGTDTQPRYISTQKNEEEIHTKLGNELLKLLKESLTNNDGTD